MGAVVRYLVRRYLVGLLVAAALAALVIGSWIAWPLEVWAPVWSLALIAALVLASLHDVGEGGDR